MSIHAQKRGMTLIEMMVALAIVGILSAMTYASMSYAMEAQERSRMVHGRYHAARLTLERLKRELSTAFLSLHQSEDKRTITTFEGDRSRVLFVSSSHEPIQRNARQSDQVEIEYKLERMDGDQVLVRRVKQYIDDSPGKGGHEEVVVTGVKAFFIEYYDKNKEDWRSDWSVRVEDAEEMRVKLKALRAQGDAVKESLEGRGAAVEALGDTAVDKAVDDAEEELLDDIYLPNRVRVRLVLVDMTEREYILETQCEIPVVEPLWY